MTIHWDEKTMQPIAVGPYEEGPKSKVVEIYPVKERVKVHRKGPGRELVTLNGHRFWMPFAKTEQGVRCTGCFCRFDSGDVMSPCPKHE